MFQPFADRVTVKLIPKPKIESKIISLKDSKETDEEYGPFKGEVIAVGQGNGGTLEMQVVPGDIVYFDQAREFEDKDWDTFHGILLLQNGQILGREV